MNWIVLFIAGVFEVAMTFCLGKTKGAQGTELYLWIGGFVLATVLSMGLLAYAVQTLPIGTAYAIWTGVGALGTVLLGIFVFGESAGFARIFFIVTLFGSIPIALKHCARRLVCNRYTTTALRMA